jgi:hypothetical protein
LPPDDVSGRIVYFYERTLTTTVNDIEHIGSQSVAGYGIVTIYFPAHGGHQCRAGAGSRGVAKLC